MIIKCPQCSTGYSIPENTIGEKPRKMRCSRCKNVFTIARRAEAAPSGYEEFTGQHHLPGEFSFLRESPATEPPPQPEEPAPPLVQPAPPAPMPAQPAPRAPEPPTDTAGPEPPAPSTDTPAPAPSTDTPAPAPPSSPSVSEIYGGTASAWETEVPLDLGGFAIPNEIPTKGQAIGKVIFVVVVLVVGFLVFVAYRNGWTISIPALGDQIAFAFSGAEFEDLPKEARDIEATINRRKIIMNRERSPFLVVQGEVTNIATDRRSKIIMRAQLIDPVGDIRGQVRAPCGKLIDDSVIKATPKGAMEGHYRSGGALYNCSIKGSGSTVFQLIFDEVPVDYDNSFEVRVQAVAARPLD